MKPIYSCIIVLWLCLCVKLSAADNYTADILGEGFVSRTFDMGTDYDGEVVATLIKKLPAKESEKAVLYLHGYNDYFFQKEMANKFDSAGYNFYAVDLRKYGRSILPGQRKFYVRDMSEYFAELDSAINVIKADKNKEIILVGHSTGGLTLSLYANERKDVKEIKALILNSPFLDMNQSWFMENIAIPTVSMFGSLFPDFTIKQGLSPGYAYSLLKDYNGEWDFNTDWKLIHSPALTSGWIRAIHQGHKKVQNDMNIQIPVLVMHSDKSFWGDDYTPEFSISDVVLDVNDIDKYGRKLGPNVKMVTINEGMHDLILSEKSVRENTYNEIFTFLR